MIQVSFYPVLLGATVSYTGGEDQYTGSSVSYVSSGITYDYYDELIYSGIYDINNNEVSRIQVA